MSSRPSCGASPHLNLTDLVTSRVTISISHPDVNRPSAQNSFVLISHLPAASHGRVQQTRGAGEGQRSAGHDGDILSSEFSRKCSLVFALEIVRAKPGCPGPVIPSFSNVLHAQALSSCLCPLEAPALPGPSHGRGLTLTVAQTHPACSEHMNTL